MSFYVYIAVDPFGSLRVGVTNDLARRLLEFQGLGAVTVRGIALQPARLVYYEVISKLPAAVNREQQLRTWRRGRLKRLINAVNPEWRDLAAVGGERPATLGDAKRRSTVWEWVRAGRVTPSA